MNTCLFL